MTTSLVSAITVRSRRKGRKTIRASKLINQHAFGSHGLELRDVINIAHTKLANQQAFGGHSLELRDVLNIVHTKLANQHAFGALAVENVTPPVGLDILLSKLYGTSAFGAHELVMGDLRPTSGLLFCDSFDSYDAVGGGTGGVGGVWVQNGGTVEYLPTGGKNGRGAFRRASSTSFIHMMTPVLNDTGVPVGEELHFAVNAKFTTSIPTSNARWLGIGVEGDSLGPASAAFLVLGANARVSLQSLDTSFPGTTIATENNGAGIGYLADKLGQWVHVEVMYKLDGASGRCKVWLDGVLIIDFTGDLSTATEGAIHRVSLVGGGDECVFDDFVAWRKAPGVTAFNYDQIGIDSNDLPKPHYIETLRPIADGDAVQLSPSGGNPNWQNVSEAWRDGTSTINTTSTDGAYDLYEFEKLDEYSALDDVLAVVSFDHHDFGTSTSEYRHRTKTNSRDFFGLNMGGSTSLNTRRFNGWPVNPETFALWTIDEVNDAQFGFQRMSAASGATRLTNMFLEVIRGGGLQDDDGGELTEQATITLTIPSGKVTADLTDFPVLIDLSKLPTDFKDTILSGAGNLRAFDMAGDALPLDVVVWDHVEQKGFAFVKLPTVFTAADTEWRLRTYTAGDKAPNNAPEGRNAVWSDYEIVLFFDDGDGWTDHAGKIVVSPGTTGHGTTGRAYVDLLDEPLFAGKGLRLYNPSSEATAFAVWGMLSGSLPAFTLGVSLQTTRQSTSNNFGVGSLLNSANQTQRASMSWRGSDSSGSDAMQAWDNTNSWLNNTPRFIPSNDAERFRGHLQYSAASSGTRRNLYNGPDGYVASAGFTSRPTTDMFVLGRAQANSTTEPGNFEYGFAYVRAEYLSDDWLRAEVDMATDPDFIDFPGEGEIVEGGLQHWNPDTSSDGLITDALRMDVTLLNSGAAGWHVAKAFDRATDKKYWEIHVLALDACSTGMAVPFTATNQKLGQTITDFGVGVRGQGIGYWNDGRVVIGGVIVQNYAPYTAGDVVMIAYDHDTRRIWFGKNGSWNGNPAAGTGWAHQLPVNTVLVSANHWMPADSVFGGHSNQARFQAGSQLHSPPSGFSSFT